MAVLMFLSVDYIHAPYLLMRIRAKLISRVRMCLVRRSYVYHHCTGSIAIGDVLQPPKTQIYI